MEEKKKSADQNHKMYRFVIPYKDTVDMARKILLMYNGYSMATGKKSIIDMRHVNLLSYYLVFGYSMETKKKFSHCFSVEMQYVAVLDTEMRKRGILVDPDGNFRSRRLCDDIENMRRLFISENQSDRCAIIALFARQSIFKEPVEEEEE